MLHYGFSSKDYYNVFNPVKYYSMEEIDYGRKNIVVAHFFHFCGESAWDRNTCHPYAALFKKYLKMSPWAESYCPEKKKKSNLLKAEKFLYRILPQKIFLYLWYNERVRKGIVYQREG